MNRRYIVLSVLLAVIAGAALLATKFLPEGMAQNMVEQAESLGQAPELPPAAPRPVSLYTVRSASAAQTRTYPGVTSSSSEVELAFRVAGPLVAVNVAPGSVVEQGEPLMQIDPRDYEDKIAVLEAQLAGAEATLEKVRLDFERTKPLRRKNVVSQSDYDTAKSSHANALAAVKNLRAQLQSARHALQDTTLRAPFAGIVTAQLLENHEMVASGQKALKMQDISSVEVHVHVPENELKHYDLRQEHAVQVSFPAIPDKEFSAQLHEWSAEADPRTRTYKVTFVLPAPEDAMILPGMTAEVRWGSPQARETLVAVPASAITSSDEGQSIVWVYDPSSGTAVSRPVQTGRLLDGERMTVLHGLEGGETIVAAGVDFVTPGMKLRPLQGKAR